MTEIDLLNNFELSRQVVMKLRGKTFKIVSCTLKAGMMVGGFKTMHDMSLANTVPGGFTIREGVTRIPLLPSRSILWDLNEGVVRVSIDGGEITIERELPHNKTIYRLILY